MTRDEIVAYLAKDGFSIEPLGESTFRSRFRGERRAFPFFVHVDRTYLSLALVPYVRLPAAVDGAEKLMVRLLELNREINFAKFSVDDDGDVVLSVEYPLADLDESEIRDALDVLSFYADRHWDEIRALASDAA